MSAFVYLKKILQLMVVLMLSLAVCSAICKLFVLKDNAIAKDYQALVAISPDTVVMYQQTQPESWKDYLAIVSARQNSAESPVESEFDRLLECLDAGRSFEELDWSGLDKKTRKTIRYYRQLLDQYSIYTPGYYLFPLKQSCYYTDTFGADREGGKRIHQGTDLFADKGTPIFNVCDGTVEKLGWNRLGGERVGVRGFDGNYYYYAHLDKINKDLQIDQIIKKGDIIGTTGNTGDAITTPDHLHFGIELPNGEWLNPYPFLKVWEFQSF